MKLYDINIHVHELQYSIQFLQHLYKEHITTKSSARKEYFKRFSVFIEILFKSLVVLYFSSIFLFDLYPLYVYFTQNELIPTMPLFIPGLDEKTVIGFICLICVQLNASTLAVIGFIACDYFYAVIISSTLIFAQLISYNLEQINIDLQEKDAKFIVSSRFRNVLQMHQDLFE